MKTFNHIYWIVSHAGWAADALSIFLNLHHRSDISWKIARGRVRTTSPGILLNWAWYYPRWARAQVNDQNLYKQLFSTGKPRFCQAHFFLKENELLQKFPGSKTITILSEDKSATEVYSKYAHAKLLDKVLYSSWYQTQRINLPIFLKENIQVADSYFRQGMTHFQYRVIAYQDLKNQFVLDSPDPVSEWVDNPYVSDFMENKNTALLSNATWSPLYDKTSQFSILIDRLANPILKTTDKEYYKLMCNMLQIAPNYTLLNNFWSAWFSRQPDVSTNYQPNLTWTYNRAI